MTLHEQIEQAFADYVKETESFEDNGVKASAARARKALSEITKLAKDRRAEIQNAKNAT